MAQVQQTRIYAIIVARRYSAINRAIFAISFFAGLRPHLICAQPSDFDTVVSPFVGLFEARIMRPFCIG
jgi:hypothetical protein